MSFYHQTQHLARQMLGLGLWLLGLRPRRSSEAAAPLGAVLFGFKGSRRRKQPTSKNRRKLWSDIDIDTLMFFFYAFSIRKSAEGVFKSAEIWKSVEPILIIAKNPDSPSTGRVHKSSTSWWDLSIFQSKSRHGIFDASDFHDPPSETCLKPLSFE